MNSFIKTVGGNRLVNTIFPDIARQLSRIANELKEANRLKRSELRQSSPSEIAEEFCTDKEDNKED